VVETYQFQYKLGKFNSDSNGFDYIFPIRLIYVISRWSFDADSDVHTFNGAELDAPGWDAAVTSTGNTISKLSAPNLLTIVGPVFRGNTVLTTVNMPKLTSIATTKITTSDEKEEDHTRAFEGCSSLITVTTDHV